MLENLHPLFRRGRPQQLADVLPCFQKRAGIIANPLDGCLPLGDLGETLLHLPFFVFQPLQFRLDAGKPPRPEALQHFHQPADVGTNLRQATAGQVFFFPEPDCLTAEARECFLNDAVTGFNHPAYLGNPPDESVLQCNRRNAGGLAGVFAAFVLLPRADVVVVHVGTAVGRCPDHVRPALAPQQAR